MVDPSSLLGALKPLYDLVRATTDAAVDHKIKGRLIEVQQGILDVQAQLADAVSERLALVAENAELRDRLRAVDASRAALDAYELVEMDDPGKYLYRSKADAGRGTPHYACPTCYAAGKVAVLQAAKTGSRQTFYKCMSCGAFKLMVGPSDPAEPRRRVVGRIVP